MLVLAAVPGCGRSDQEPALSEQQAAAVVIDHIEADYPTGLGTTWQVDVEAVDLVWESSWLPWRDPRPVYEVRVVTRGPLDPTDPESPSVRAVSVFEVDGGAGTVRLRTAP